MNAVAATGIGVWVALITGVLSFVGVIFVGVYTSRSSRAASRETAQMTTQAKGWDDLTKSHSAEIARLREERKEDRAQLVECNARIDDLTRRFEAAERRERALIGWARDVVRIMRDAKLPFPAPPPGVADTDPDGVAPIR